MPEGALARFELRAPGLAVCTLAAVVFASGLALGDDAPAATAVSELEGPESCGSCHPQQFRQWRGSMHAYSAMDPIFQACNRRALEDTGGAVGPLCVTCHVPLGVRSGEVDGAFDSVGASALANSGVSCEFCHKVSGPEHGQPEANASLRWSAEQALLGPLADPRSFPAHASASTEFLGAPEFCGRCHDVRLGDRLLERTYAQWSESIHRERDVGCQDCHMQRYSGRAAEDGPFRETLRRHDFPGVSLPLIPFPNRGSQAERIEEILRATASLSVAVPREIRAGDDLEIRARVKNSGAGHNVPTGFSTKRQMWLEVLVRDSEGRTLFRSGHVDSNGDVLDHHSRIEPGGDPWLVSFSDRFLDAAGREVRFIWQAARLEERSLKPLEERSATYAWHPPESLLGDRLHVSVRLLFRPFAPYVLHDLGLDSLVAQLPTWEMARFDSDPIEVVRNVSRPTRYSVPGDFESIPDALRELEDGDTIVVEPGEYRIARPLDFLGKSIRLVSVGGRDRTTIVFDGPAESARSSVVVFQSGERPGARLEGFTLRAGRGTRIDGLYRGGGVYIARSSPTLVSNRIAGCTAPGGVGGGIAVEDGGPRLEDNEIVGCQAERGGAIALLSSRGLQVLVGGQLSGCVARIGGGVYADGGGRVRLERVLLAGNIAWELGGGVALGGGVSLDLSHVTLAQNAAGRGPGAIAELDRNPADVSRKTRVRLRNSIVWGNDLPEVVGDAAYCVLDPAGSRSIRGAPGSENAWAFPVFRDPGGLWDPRPGILDGDGDGGGDGDRGGSAPWSVGSWIGGDYRLLPGSPAVDAGDPDSPADPDDTRADVGARFFEQPLRAFVRGDADGDGVVDGADLRVVAAHLLYRGGALRCLDAADADDSGAVDPVDLARLAGFVFFGASPPEPPFPRCGLDPTFGEGLSCDEKADPCRGIPPPDR